MTTTLTENIAAALDVAMHDVHAQLDTELAARAINLHYAAVRNPGSSEPDRRTTSMRNYVRVLAAAHVEFPNVEAAVEKMLADSLPESFLAWTGQFCRDNPAVSEEDISSRMIEFQTFIALRSLTSTVETIDALFDLEEKARDKFETAKAKYDVTVQAAKATIDKVRGAYEEAGRRRVRASGLSDEADALTVRVSDDLREATRAAEQRYQQRKANPTRNRKGKSTEPATEPTSAESAQVQTTTAEGDTA